MGTRAHASSPVAACNGGISRTLRAVAASLAASAVAFTVVATVALGALGGRHVSATPAVQQANAPSASASTNLAEELRYARALAARFQFLDLAEDVIANVEGQRLGPEEQEFLTLARAQIFGEAARFQSDPDRRRELFNQALGAYEAFLKKHPLSPNISEARRAYVELGATYGLLAEQDLAEASGARATELKDRAVERLTAIAAFTGTAVADFGEPATLDQIQRRDLAQMMLSRGQLLLQLGRLLGDEGTFYLDSGESALEQLIYLMGDDTGWGMNAYILIAEIQLTRESAEDALATTEWVVDRAIPMAADRWNALIAELSLTRADKDARWSFVEVGVPLAMRCARELGQQETSLRFALYFYNTLSREGFSLSQRGYLTLIDVGRELLNAGGVLGGSPAAGTLEWFETLEDAQAGGHAVRNIRSSTELALTLASRASDDNPRSYVQTQAQRLVSDAITLPGVVVSADVLFQAAFGDLNSGDYEAAVRAFKRVLSNADASDRVLFGGKVYLNIGRALQRQGRLLEAAMAFEEGARRYSGDAESAILAAPEFYRAIGAVRRRSAGDPVVEALYLEAERVATDLGSSDSGDIFLRQGQRASDEGRFAEAREIFQQVPADSRTREAATVKAAIALYAAGDLEAARAELTEYVGVFVRDPRNRLGPQDGARIERRKLAVAEASYYLGRIALDQKRWDDVITRLANFESEHPGQNELAAAALDHSATAELERGNYDAARGYLEQLEARYRDNPRTGAVATRLYNTLVALHDNAKAVGDVERTAELKGQMVQLLSLSNRLNPNPTYQSLRDEGLFWLEVGDPAKSEAALRRFIQAYGELSQLAQQREVIVLPALGRSLLEQRRAQEAYDVLATLVPAAADKGDTRRPSVDTAQTYVRSIAGWIEGEGSEPVIVPGIGGASRLDEARQWQSKISAARESWSCDWYASEAESVWIMIQQGRLDSTRMETARRAITGLAARLGQDFALIREACGGDTTVQRRFQWLRKQVGS